MRINKRTGLLVLLLCTCITVIARQGDLTVYGKVLTPSGEPVEEASVFIENTSVITTTDDGGRYRLEDVISEVVRVVVFYPGTETQVKEVNQRSGSVEVNFTLSELSEELEEVVISDILEKSYGIRRLRSVEGMGIYEAKKSEVIVLEDITANLATNNPRQAFAKVPGLLIWESDGAGLQLGIGARGLSPNRTSHFNVRQNGYDISADALGYPESYYTPPLEALKQIELVRGAASLQYGTQFGGMLNFVFKRGPEDRKFSFTSRQTIGSFGLFNSFNSVGGQVGKVNYYGFYQHKRGDGWRPNSGFDLDMAYGAVSVDLSDKLTIGSDFTYMHYLAQQPGGLTDVDFQNDPRQSKRDRNFFMVDWNLASLTLDYRLSDRTKINSRNFFLYSGREALGNLSRITMVDLGGNRTLLSDSYRNYGNETRLMHHYPMGSQKNVLLVGTRFYTGHTNRKQGDASDGADTDFRFLNPDNLENSDFDFPNRNLALFAENIFNVTQKFSITPGVRLEYIRTRSEGFYRQVVRDFAGNIISDNRFDESKNNERAFVLGGVGLSYKLNEDRELYGNFSQNFRSITFSDLRVVNENVRVDENLTDERGFNIDLGIRGSERDGLINYDVSAFYLRYNDRIGFVNRIDTVLNIDQRYRSNVGNAYSAGIEAFAEADIWRLAAGKGSRHGLNLFVNAAFINAEYLSSNLPDLEDQQGNVSTKGKKLELVSPFTLRTGLNYSQGNFSLSSQFSYTHQHYTDAFNTEFTPTAVSGVIPSYYVVDISARYSYRKFTLSGGVNNATDNKYFTRRADGYPGPGIIPADGRSIYLTLGFTY
ncbi:TonB-dependent receptor domain-containing protein [Roseivirga sp. BDSF3-8]|uniref:TonB-dependent receptor domain-containing protein n=1 Tax=Roseivirga sp. BDSF3-8 TaxID=3241598 RepID=UPI0035325105